jgi:hypothetical protein
MDPVYTAGLAVHPELEALDWPKQRLVAAGALRAAELLVVEPNRGLRAARRLMDPRPLIGSELAQLDEWTRGERYPLEKDLAGRSWPILAAAEVVRGRQRDLGKKLARIDQRLADRLYAAAVTTMREALKRAGVKAKVRARNRAKDAQAQLDEIGMTDAVLAAINVRADELLDRSFEAYGVDARSRPRTGLDVRPSRSRGRSTPMISTTRTRGTGRSRRRRSCWCCSSGGPARRWRRRPRRWSRWCRSPSRWCGPRCGSVMGRRRSRARRGFS